jgi:hypothetical protein
LKEYERQKSTLQPDSGIAIIDYKPSTNAVNHLQKDLEKQYLVPSQFLGLKKEPNFQKDDDLMKMRK